MFTEIDRPTSRPADHRRIPLDPQLVEALRSTEHSGRARFVPVRADVQGQPLGPVKGLFYSEGYGLHFRLVSGGYAVWVERDVMRCSHCSTTFDIVDYVANGGDRLRRRDTCPKCNVGQLKGL